MGTPYDTLAKDLLEVLLDDLGAVEREHEVSPPSSQRADLRFVPSDDPAKVTARHALGLLGRMTESATLFEAFHDAPSLAEVLRCLRKLLNAAHTEGDTQMWLLCAGRPDDALARLDARPSAHWPRGFYALAPALPLRLVVLAELPTDDDTLTLRLMGAGATLRAALADLRVRYGALPRGRALYVTVVQRFVAARRRGQPLQEDPVIDLNEAEKILADKLNQGIALGRNEGIALGRNEGIALGVALAARLCERHLGRTLTTAERDTLAARFEGLGPDRLGEVLDLAPDDLTRWLADPDAR